MIHPSWLRIRAVVGQRRDLGMEVDVCGWGRGTIRVVGGGGGKHGQ